MRYMNDYDIEIARRRFSDFPNLALGVEILDRLREWTNRNSDGWAYWKLPLQAAKRLMEILEDEQRRRDYLNGVLEDIDEKELSRAILPIKSFLTRQGAKWQEVLG